MLRARVFIGEGVPQLPRTCVPIQAKVARADCQPTPRRTEQEYRLRVSRKAAADGADDVCAIGATEAFAGRLRSLEGVPQLFDIGEHNTHRHVT